VIGWRVGALVAVLGLVAACAGGSDGTRTTAGAGSDVDVLVEALERMHPNPWHDVSEQGFKAAADRLERRFPRLSKNERLVGLMRLLTLLGPREGHSGIYPLEPGHRRPMHFYPLYLYAFSDGLYVVATAGRDELLGSRLVAVAGTPAEEVLAAAQPLFSRDNELSHLHNTTQLMLVPELLQGLGIVPEVGATEFTFEDPTGAARDVSLEPITLDAYTEELSDDFPSFVFSLPERGDILSLSRLEPDWWLARLDGGRVLYLAYQHVQGDPADVSERLLRLARRPQAERVIVDLRWNGGGDNTTYWPLLSASSSPAIDRPRRLYCLIGRATFSAAANFVTELEREADNVTFVGEPTGGAPNQYGDSEPVELPETGWIAYLPVEYVEKSDPADPRLAIEPHVPVAWSAEDYFAGRDPVLAAALSHRR
jgi:hypothetical protein